LLIGAEQTNGRVKVIHSGYNPEKTLLNPERREEGMTPEQFIRKQIRGWKREYGNKPSSVNARVMFRLIAGQAKAKKLDFEKIWLDEVK